MAVRRSELNRDFVLGLILSWRFQPRLKQECVIAQYSPRVASFRRPIIFIRPLKNNIAKIGNVLGRVSFQCCVNDFLANLKIGLLMEIQQHQLTPGIKRVTDESVRNDILFQIFLEVLGSARPDILYCIGVLGVVVLVLGVFIGIFAIGVEDDLPDARSGVVFQRRANTDFKMILVVLDLPVASFRTGPSFVRANLLALS